MCIAPSSKEKSNYLVKVKNDGLKTLTMRRTILSSDTHSLTNNNSIVKFIFQHQSYAKIIIHIVTLRQRERERETVLSLQLVFDK